MEYSSMASMRLLHRLLLLIIFVLIYNNRCMCNILDEKKLSDHLLTFVNNLTDYQNLQNESDAMTGTFVEIDGFKLIDLYKDDLEQRFEEKKEAVRRVKKRAEQAKNSSVKSTKQDHDLEKLKEENYYPYRNMKVYETDDTTLAINPHFSLDVKVNMSESFVHVPTNIYAKSLKVLDIVTWTKELDEVFNESYTLDNKLLYQYYGDHQGILRVFPGNNNNYTVNQTYDLYDCRRRPWYVQATSSPKDVVIIIDHSGSMIGSNIGIAKIATASLIDTLEENDFFNVITVNKNVTYMKPCLEYLLQATKKNKEKMKNLVQAIDTPKYELNHTMGLEAAFKLLNPGSDFNRTYAECNQAIMFITDGIESDYTEEKKLFEKYNKNKDTRVFTYLVGRKKSPDKKALLDMACQNNGYFYTLETLGNVWDTVLEYLYVMSRPINEEKAMYTPVYLDSTGLGMIISISLSVFSGNKKSKFIGVAGTDITIKSLDDIIPHSKLGVFGHAFVISNNGFIVLHPKLRLQTGRLPSPPNILMEELERAVAVGVDNEIIRLKRDMIDRKLENETNENNTFAVYFTYDYDDRKISILNASYNHRPINDTEFSAAIVLATSEKRQFNFTSDDDTILVKGIRLLNTTYIDLSIPNITIDNHTFISVAPWNYMPDLVAEEQQNSPNSVKVYPTAQEIFSELQYVSTWNELENHPKVPASRRLLNNLLISVGHFVKDDKVWVPDEMRNDRETYESIFIATASGYSKLFTYNNLTKPYDRDIINTPIFQHALANPDAKVIFSAPYSEAPNFDQLITAVAPIRKEDVIVAVTGFRFKGELMKLLLENITGSFERENSPCKKNDTYICALVDQNGFILASNLGPHNIGRFIGEQSRAIIDKLVEEKAMKEINLEDTQADCPWTGHSRASANILLTPAKLIIKSFIFLFQTLSYITMQTSWFVISIFRSYVYASGGDNPNIQVSCTHKWDFFLFQKDKIEDFNDKRHKQKCSPNNNRCKLEFIRVQFVPDTNLFFLEINMYDKSCADECRKLKRELKRIKTDDEHYCVNDTKTSTTKLQNDRRKPSTCFKPVDEKKDACGRAGVVKPTLFSFMLVLFLCMYVITY